ncbi:MAG: hypothetical protein JXA96_00735, partial [Sedimentisphaerales bacterium]|nr:hypothetical protein [Sedimentisphaerales bacterium]
MMCKKIICLIFSICLCVGFSSGQEQLKIDFSIVGGPVESGYEAYTATLEVANTFTEQSFQAFGTTVTVQPTWPSAAPAAAMQMHDRSTDDRYAYTGEYGSLIQDWTGTDGREANANPLILTLSGLPKGNYSWLSYHHDGIDQTGVFSVTVNDALDSITTEDVEITNSSGGDSITDFESISKFSTEFTSNGTDDVTFEFTITSSTTNLGTAFFVMNGFEIERTSGVSLNIAKKPQPQHKEKDVLPDVILTWTPGDSADKHNVFFGVDFNDVNDATIDEPLGTTVSPGQALDANTYIPENLEFGKTYYWRVDEVNAPSSPGINKGNIWSFT